MNDNVIKICMGSSCFARGNKENLETIKGFLKEHNIEAEVILTGNLCSEKCNTGPNLYFNNILFQNVDQTQIDIMLNQVLTECGNVHS